MTARLGVEVLSARGRRRKSRLAKTLRAVNARVGVVPSESDPRGSGSYIALVKRPLGERHDPRRENILEGLRNIGRDFSPCVSKQGRRSPSVET